MNKNTDQFHLFKILCILKLKSDKIELRSYIPATGLLKLHIVNSKFFLYLKVDRYAINIMTKFDNGPVKLKYVSD
jgi:hypothetical protein